MRNYTVRQVRANCDYGGMQNMICYRAAVLLHCCMHVATIVLT